MKWCFARGVMFVRCIECADLFGIDIALESGVRGVSGSEDYAT